MTAWTPEVPFWDQRPTWLCDLIDKSFAMVSDPSFNGYHILASDDYNLGEFAASDLVRTCLADHRRQNKSFSNNFRLLDVGCGEGRFVESMLRSSEPASLSVVGVSAFAYNATLPTEMGFVLRMVNAERVLASPDFQKDIHSDSLYDCIVSAETFRHFQDPLGTLCQMFDLLRVGGVLAVDRLHVQGLHSAQLLVDWWRKAGVDVSAETIGTRIAPLLLRKTNKSQTLRVPVMYTEKQGSGNLEQDVYVFNEDMLEHPLPEQFQDDVGSQKLSQVSPPWCRLRCASKVPQAQWRQVESLLQRLSRVGR